MTYCEEMKLLIFDRILLGIIILILGFLINKLLERYKSRVSIVKEFTTAKINKISETWNILIDLEEDAQIIIDKVFTIRVFINSSFEEQTKAIINETSQLDENLKQKINSVNKALKQNHFWIGKDYFKRFSDYKDSIIEYYSAVMHNKDVDFAEMKRKLDCNKEDLIKIVKENL